MILRITETVINGLSYIDGIFEKKILGTKIYQLFGRLRLFIL